MFPVLENLCFIHVAHCIFTYIHLCLLSGQRMIEATGPPTIEMADEHGDTETAGDSAEESNTETILNGIKKLMIFELHNVNIYI